MNYTEEARAAGEGRHRGGTPRGRLPLRALLSTLFLLSSLPLGSAWLAVLLVLLLAGVPLGIVWAGMPVLALVAPACVYGVRVERRRLDALLGARLPSPFRPLPRGPAIARARAMATDPALRRGLLYLVLLVPVGLVELVVVLLLAVSAALATYPLWFWALSGGRAVMATGAFVADTVPEALLVALVGLVLGSAAAVFGAQACQAHAALGRRLLGRRETLEERVEVLTESRSRAVEAAIAERRRIERDLHDGAQQRLVSLAMALGMARQKLENGRGAAGDSETAKAAELVGEAHEEAKRALAEIRNLVRNIHPAVLTDRGLDAAVSALAGRSPVPVSVDVALDERPPDAVEITAYFVIAEALANVAKHSGASEARVSVRREMGPYAANGKLPEDLLVVEVVDDGEGGADPAGTGLEGLADRVVVLDGRLTVESPVGGPTVVRAELPWGGPEGSPRGSRDDE